MYSSRTTNLRECLSLDGIDRYYYITKYARAAGGAWATDATWSTTSGGAADTTKPTSSDDVILDANSGAVTIGAAADCKTLTMTDYTNTLTHNGAGLQPRGNVTFGAGMTYTVAGGWINFFANGTLTTNGKTMTNIVNAATATITLGDNLTFNSNIVALILTGPLNLNGKTITGNTGASRLLIRSNTVGTPVTITVGGGTFANADFQDITFSSATDVDLSAITGGSGDCGGNTITGGGTVLAFTPATTQTCTMSTNQNWSTAGIWTSRVPLPQDNVSLAGVTGGILTADMPRLGKSIDWTGATGNPVWNISVATAVYGSVTLINGMTRSNSNILIFSGRSNYTITSAGVVFTGGLAFSCPNGTYTLNDALTCNRNGSVNFNLTAGTFNDGGFSVTYTGANSTWVISGGTLTASGIWNFGGTAAATFWSCTGSPTLNTSGMTINITTASTNTRTFAGNGLTYGTLTYTVAGSTGKLTLTGSNSFAAINFSDATNARTLEFTAGTTTTIRNANGFNVQGTSGKLMTIQSATASGHTLSSSQLQSCDYLSISRSTAEGGGSWYAGANSTDGGNNVGWIFGAPPSGSGGIGGVGIRNLQNLQNLMSL